MIELLICKILGHDWPEDLNEWSQCGRCLYIYRYWIKNEKANLKICKHCGGKL